MTLADTSTWVNHLRRRDALLFQLLVHRSIVIHPFVLGELAAGTIPDRPVALRYLRRLPQTPIARDSEVHHLVETRKLWGRGLGWVDLHLLASALFGRFTMLTEDRRLREAAQELGIGPPVH
jgi:predicted nucleic acid-binding protein